MLRAGGNRVEVQNYIDNTGVQVADVVVGFHYLENKTLGRRAGAARRPRRPLRLLLLGPLRAHLQLLQGPSGSRCTGAAQTLHAIEAGEGEVAELAHLVADAIVQAHLTTMLRLDVEYDVLPRESEILHLQVLGRRVRAAERAQGHLLRDRRQELPAAG